MTLIESLRYFFEYAGAYLSNELWPRVLDFVQAPIKVPSMLWMLLPLLATLIMMELYFGRYKKEELGWNTAFGNSLVLIFVSIDLFRHLYEPAGNGVFLFIVSGADKIWIPLVVFFLGLLLMFVDFFHFLPSKVAYIISSPVYINFIGLLGIITVYYDKILIDWTTMFAGWIWFIIINILAQILFWIVPTYTPPLKRILTVEDVEEYRVKKK